MLSILVLLLTRLLRLLFMTVITVCLPLMLTLRLLLILTTLRKFLRQLVVTLFLVLSGPLATLDLALCEIQPLCCPPCDRSPGRACGGAPGRLIILGTIVFAVAIVPFVPPVVPLVLCSSPVLRVGALGRGPPWTI